MMFLDASAVIAIIAGESDAANLAARLGQAAKVVTSPIAVYEAVLGLARAGNLSIADATLLLDRFLAEVDATVMPIDAPCGGPLGVRALWQRPPSRRPQPWRLFR